MIRLSNRKAVLQSFNIQITDSIYVRTYYWQKKNLYGTVPVPVPATVIVAVCTVPVIEFFFKKMFLYRPLRSLFHAIVYNFTPLRSVKKPLSSSTAICISPKKNCPCEKKENLPYQYRMRVQQQKQFSMNFGKKRKLFTNKQILIK